MKKSRRKESKKSNKKRKKIVSLAKLKASSMMMKKNQSNINLSSMKSRRKSLLALISTLEPSTQIKSHQNGNNSLTLSI